MTAARSLFVLSMALSACTPGVVGLGDGGRQDAGAMSGADAARTCTGCTDPETGACLRGTSDTSCGGPGGDCVSCGDGRTCVERVCADRDPCTAENCPGCCDGDLCVTSERDDACGSGGATCVACAAGEACVDGVCGATSSCGPASCAGCCDAGEACQSGDTVTACGGAGASCEACQPGWSCTGGACTPPCAEVCDGCCDGEECLDGTEAGACGLGGDACVDCGTIGDCSFGACVATSSCGPANCDGCCDGGLCLSGTRSGACGAGGRACVDCGASFLCSGSGACEVDPFSRWDLEVIWASFSSSNPSGSSWDPAAGRPDPYTTAEASSASGMSYRGQTSIENNTTFPYWDEVVLMDVPARDLVAGTLLRVIDDDGIGDDDIGFCFWRPSQTAFRNAGATLICPERASDPRTVETRLRVGLVRR